MAGFNLSDGNEFFLNVHNPSNIDQKLAVISVPNGHFEVAAWNSTAQDFTPTAVDVLCNADLDREKNPITNCHLYFEANTEAYSLNLFRLTYNSAVDNERHPVNAAAGSQIHTFDSEQTLAFDGYDSETAELSFSLHDNKFMSTHKLHFGVKYWPSYCDYHNPGSSSGIYAFRQIDRLYQPLKYSELKDMKVYPDAQMVQKFFFTFQSANAVTGQPERNIFVHLTLDADLNVMKFDVDLDSLPEIFLHGYEVVTTFRAEEVNNQGVFYTDSNGLEMQNRTRNFRNYYNLTDRMYKYNNQNVTANYYPINSAIALKDLSNGNQLTVSNDRAQGGSSEADGAVEFMQNRRIPCDDGKGEDEFLNETDTFGRGIRVPATYHVQLGNSKQRPSFQRQVQMKNADPLQISFSSAPLQKVGIASGDAKILNVPVTKVGSAVNQMGLKYVLVPVEKNKMFVRVQNMNDHFDGATDALPIDMEAFAKKYWADQNPTAALESVKITEMSVTGNLEKSVMEERRLHWKTTEEPSGPQTPESQDGVQPMQIRVFQVEFTPGPKDIEIIQ